MKRGAIVAALALVGVFVAGTLFAQTPEQPRPGPEVQKLAYFVGEWKFEGDSKESAFGPAGKFSGTETCEWFAGGFQVICRSAATGPAGKITGLSIFAYDGEKKQYTVYGIDSTGFSLLASGTVSGDTWTYDWTGTVGGKPAKIQATMQTSERAYTGRTRGSFGGPMTEIDEVRATRVK